MCLRMSYRHKKLTTLSMLLLLQLFTLSAWHHHLDSWLHQKIRSHYRVFLLLFPNTQIRFFLRISWSLYLHDTILVLAEVTSQWIPAIASCLVFLSWRSFLASQCRETMNINSLYILMWLLNKPKIKKYHMAFRIKAQISKVVPRPSWSHFCL